ncbi:12469_t:CDS:2 [Racocetra fulgida]|uniref:Fumarylacetoacetase n=1 Tax=Racocetra fulgida TaxID=60492 RepID=A0A9N9FAH3_9GLOM|nr:12469_t:CDS:2 [Racocetra fulgida]
MKSFIEVSADSHFPIQNLPFGIFSIAEDKISSARVGVAIGDQILDLTVLSKLFEKHVPELATRKFLQAILSEDNPELRDNKELRNQAFVPQKLAKMHLPANIGHYTDFYASKEHATNCVVVSGTDILRPRGQRSPGKDQPPVFGPSTKLDIELEMDPTPFPYLQEEGKTAYDIHLEVKMKRSLLEITWNGKNEIDFGNGVKRLFVEDGDEVVLTGHCQGEGYKVGFGECSGKILPAISS